MKTSALKLAAVCASLLTLMACANYRDYPRGESLASITELQTANPRGFEGEKEGLDAYKAENALQVYRGDVGQPTTIKQEAQARKQE
ncbi:hypothetical protein G8770_16510 [Aestuariicella hydrocarbonica]|uniref:Lipoprotein n=1 Tax=Pseudomaricurvus hydrocarbonicus TaxID=1470433 RepID=A0A9E5MMW8_9GAMM|nr:hypothetical protein [Aestuariicella hydrocarbonica]NHO67152.1 hypothetical protein [Aestuariicella hydrocarbonica]